MRLFGSQPAKMDRRRGGVGPSRRPSAFPSVSRADLAAAPGMNESRRMPIRFLRQFLVRKARPERGLFRGQAGSQTAENTFAVSGPGWGECDVRKRLHLTQPVRCVVQPPQSFTRRFQKRLSCPPQLAGFAVRVSCRSIARWNIRSSVWTASSFRRRLIGMAPIIVA